MTKDEQGAVVFPSILRQLDETIARYGLLPFSLIVVGALFVVGGIVVFLWPKPATVTFVDSSSLLASQEKKATILVDIEGAVEQPGVYQLSYDARIQDGLIAAGGLASNADRGYVARTINQAARLIDGGKIYIPSVVESRFGEVKSQKSEVKSSQRISSLDASTLININAASASELEKLRGVGPVTAEKIIKGRPYQRIEELREKRIVNSRVWEEIRDKITIF